MKVSILALVLGGVVAGGASAGLSPEDATTPEELFCAASRVVVVEVEKVSPGRATKGDPARVEVKVLESLSGAGIPGVEERWSFGWLPRAHGVDWGGPEAEAMIRTWEAEPFPGPSVGSRWILAVPDEGEGIGFTPARRRPEGERDWAVRAVACGGEEESEEAEEAEVEEVSEEPAESEEEVPGEGSDPDAWDAMIGAATGTLRVCPDRWIQNRMPGVVPMPGTAPEPARDYFLVGGRRREIAEFDGEWLQENCDLTPEQVW